NHVFICYARKDKEFVLKLGGILKRRSVPVWLDAWDIPAGANYNESIDKAIEGCAQFLLILSPAARDSREVEGEWLFALQEGKAIIPVLYQSCRIPRQLLPLQRVDFSTCGLEDEETLRQLVDVLREGQNTRTESTAAASAGHTEPVPPVEVA